MMFALEQGAPQGASVAVEARQLQKLLIADGDVAFSSELMRAARGRGMSVASGSDLNDVLGQIKQFRPDYAVIEQRSATESLTPIIQAAREANRNVKCIVVTRYPSIASAVKAIKQGAWDYVGKPTTAEVVLDSLVGQPTETELPEQDVQPLSVSRLEWEHIQRVLDLHGDNISATARALGMHRRTLQRKLTKYPALR